MSGVFIQGRDGFREAIFFDHKGRKQQHKHKPSKICSANTTSCCTAEKSQEHVAWRKICEETLAWNLIKDLIEKYRSCDVYFN